MIAARAVQLTAESQVCCMKILSNQPVNLSGGCLMVIMKVKFLCVYVCVCVCVCMHL